MDTLRLDDNSPYAGLALTYTGGYALVTKNGHAIATGRNRVRVHRAVLYDAIGPGPHPCAYCGVDGLEWGLGNSDPNNLTVDHANHDKLDCRLSNLRATHSWCNNNRHVVEGLRIPWEVIAALPLADRPNLRTRENEPTEDAYKLAAGPATSPEPTAASVASDEGVGVPASTPTPVLAEPSTAGEHRIYTWDDFVDLGEFAKGNIRLIGPPRWLLDKHPALRKVDFSRFGR